MPKPCQGFEGQQALDGWDVLEGHVFTLLCLVLGAAVQGAAVQGGCKGHRGTLLVYR
jgi:hypothetical protein